MATKLNSLPEVSPSVGISRRGFVKLGGALFVSLAIPGEITKLGAATSNTPDATQLISWLEIRSDHTILARTGRTETGTGMSAYYAQVLAEELNVRPESITMILGDTDKTPEGGYSAGFLSGAANLRKVAAYTHQALLSLASQKFSVPVADLTVTDGVVSGSGQSISYSELVAGQHLELKIPIEGQLAHPDPHEWHGIAGLDGYTVTGEPPVKPISQYKVIGQSHPMPGIPAKITGKAEWTCDVTLPGMLHARMIRPAALGATLISVPEIDHQKFPNAAIVKKANLVAVVSPNEWEAVSAARVVAAATKWTDWSGLPGTENLTKTIRAYPWSKPFQANGKPEDVNAALSKSAKTISSTYEQPFVRHAPIGPFLAVADVRPDGNVTVYTHSAQSQGLRARLSQMLGISTEKIIVRWLDHSGQYGRTTFGGDGAEADAVILSQMLGKPVRVQWTLQDDLAWSSLSPASVADLAVGLNENGSISAFHSKTYSTPSFDARMLGAVLADLPGAEHGAQSFIATEWVYNKISNRSEEVYAMPNLAADSPYGGLRGNIMRTPGQRQQNFALEGLMNEAAAAANQDPIAYRLQHTTDQRMIALLKATAHEAGWQPRPSPQKSPRKSGTEPIQGHGVCIMLRANGYWVGIAEITLIPDSGAVQVTKFTIGADVGKIINPRQLGLCMKSGVAMGLSEALKEEVTFDQSKVTSTNWDRYKILTMAEMPEIKIVQISRDDCGYGGGSEAANAVVPPAVAAAIFDAAGVTPRRLPLSPAYLTNLLKT